MSNFAERPPILYQEVAPPSALAGLVFCYWKFEYNPLGDGTANPKVLHHSVLPDGCVSLFFQNCESSQGGRMLIGFLGPRTTVFKTEVPPGHMIVGVRLFPAVANFLFGITGAMLRDKVIDATPYTRGLDFESIPAKLKPGFTDFRLLDALLLKCAEKAVELPDSDVVRAINGILESGGKTRIGPVSSSAVVSERQLQREFKRSVGLTMKEFARVRRMRNSVIDYLMNDRNLQDLVHDNGYCDQAHLIKDYSLVSTTNPTALLKYLSEISHKDVT